MRVVQHIVVSALVSWLVYIILRSVAASVAAFIAGIFLDVDHFLDYFINYGLMVRMKQVRHFFRAFKHEVMRYIVVFLHSWELLFLSFVFAWLSGWDPVATGVFAGAAIHLVLDDIFNGHSAPAYFFSYRMFHGFAGEKFYGERELRERMAALESERRTPP